jgi:8-oxo-dGTP pyrophosphatase MutT (NUDIX family)
VDACHQIVEPGENPADCAVREVLEESGIDAVARRLAWVHVTRMVVHANGDRAQYLDHVFRMDWVGGEPFPADDESLQARWFDLAEMPDISDDMRRRIEHAQVDKLTAPTVFETIRP